MMVGEDPASNYFSFEKASKVWFY